MVKWNEIVRTLTDEGVKEEDIEKCMTWAFGEGYGDTLIDESLAKWEKLHPELSFLIRGTDEMLFGIRLIARAYLFNCKEQ